MKYWVRQGSISQTGTFFSFSGTETTLT